MCVCVYIYIYMYVCVYVYMYIYVYYIIMYKHMYVSHYIKLLVINDLEVNAHMHTRIQTTWIKAI